MQDVLDFISHFSGAEDTFLHGCCYWFAWILHERFHGDGYYVYIMHDPIEGHFLALFNSIDNPLDCRFFDIRGDVTEKYRFENLDRLDELKWKDKTYYDHLMRDCRNFFPPDDVS